ncbi:MAG: hypothetical protein KGQ46_06825 [Hyphomicrobiales bacterium]|nr:hypothetical protein [Hyphomicrobiales bacterium]MDE2115048.1 hypothetical protein [Hyphomicrobiales bacterium]
MSNFLIQFLFRAKFMAEKRLFRSGGARMLESCAAVARLQQFYRGCNPLERKSRRAVNDYAPRQDIHVPVSMPLPVSKNASKTLACGMAQQLIQCQAEREFHAI